MAHPAPGPRVQTASIDYTELRVLCAMCRLPDASGAELAASLGLGSSTVAQVKARLRRRGVWRNAYVARLETESFGPLLGFWGRTTSAAPEDGFGPAIRGVLEGLHIPALVLSEGAHFAGVALPGGLSEGLALEAEVLGLREAASSRPLVDWFRMNAFARAFTLEAKLFEYGDFLERLLPAHLRPRVPSPRGASAPRPRGEPAPAGPTATKVAGEILGNVHRGVGESARACGISLSTYAHTKSALLRSGVIERRLRVDTAALGFRFFELMAVEHRPAGKRGSLPGWLEGARFANAPTLFFGSSLCTVAVTPYRTLAEAHRAEGEFRAWAAGQEPLVPPVALCFDRQALEWFVHDEGAKPSVASLMGISRLAGERPPSA